MQKRLFMAALLLAGSAAVQAADLTIPAGQVYTIEPQLSDLRLDRLSIGDGATVRFAPGVTRWRVDAQHVSIGNNVVIDGRGAAGSAGADGTAFSERAKDCDPGANGRAGGAGGAGVNGTSLVLWWGIDSWGSAKILTDGGAGAAGGIGGAGQDGGKVNRCAGPAAGNGGVGGAGGKGGNAGELTLNYYDASGKKLAIADRLSISATGGIGGAGGNGGAGGVGAEGRFQRTATSDVWFPAGKAGQRGAAGQSAAAGNNAVVEVKQLTAVARPSWANEIGSMAAADRGTMQTLQQQVQALQSQQQVQTRPSSPAETGSADLLRALQERFDKLEQRVKVLESR